jgi:hypothetical protein
VAGFSFALALRNSGNVAKTTDQHCRNSCKQYGTYLKSGKGIHTAHAHECGDEAQKHTDGAGTSPDPKQKFNQGRPKEL